MATTPQHGIKVIIDFERLAAEGQFTKEVLGTLSGAGVDQVFYTRNFPITTDAGAATNTETNVNCYTDDGTPGSWTEYDDDESDFTMVGSTGQVTIKAAENQGGNAGEEISIDYYTTYEMARGQSFDLELARVIETIHKLGGDGDVEDLVAGTKAPVKFTCMDLWVDRRMFGPLLGTSSYYKLAESMSLKVYPAGQGIGETYFTIEEAVMENVKLKGSTSTMLEVSCTFKGVVLTPGTVS